MIKVGERATRIFFRGILEKDSYGAEGGTRKKSNKVNKLGVSGVQNEEKRDISCTLYAPRFKYNKRGGAFRGTYPFLAVKSPKPPGELRHINTYNIHVCMCGIHTPGTPGAKNFSGIFLEIKLVNQ